MEVHEKPVFILALNTCILFFFFYRWLSGRITDVVAGRLLMPSEVKAAGSIVG
jgi:hypothetical protein